MGKGEMWGQGRLPRLPAGLPGAGSGRWREGGGLSWQSWDMSLPRGALLQPDMAGDPDPALRSSGFYEKRHANGAQDPVWEGEQVPPEEGLRIHTALTDSTRLCNVRCFRHPPARG